MDFLTFNPSFGSYKGPGFGIGAAVIACLAGLTGFFIILYIRKNYQRKEQHQELSAAQSSSTEERRRLIDR